MLQPSSRAIVEGFAAEARRLSALSDERVCAALPTFRVLAERTHIVEGDFTGTVWEWSVLHDMAKN